MITWPKWWPYTNMGKPVRFWPKPGHLPPTVVSRVPQCMNCGMRYTHERPYGGVCASDGVHMCEPCWQAYEQDWPFPPFAEGKARA
jgi:hypothetical protein